MIQMCDGDGLRNIADSAQLREMFDQVVANAMAFFKKVGRADKYSRTSIWR